MRFSSWFHRTARRQHLPPSRRTFAPHLESLEDRALPSAVLANSPVDVPAAVSAQASPGSSLIAVYGFQQSAPVNYTFDLPLQARVVENGQGVAGVSVTFTAPAGGASGFFGSFPASGFFGLFAQSATVLTDGTGLASAPAFTANGTLGTYNVTASTQGVAGPVSFPVQNVPDPGFPSPPPGFVEWQLEFNRQALPYFNTPQGESDLSSEFGTWFALAYLQSPQQATQLVWQEFGLMQEFLNTGGPGFLLDRDPKAWGLSHDIIANPVYTTLVGYGLALVESEWLLVSAM
jgi:hypothetical protein